MTEEQGARHVVEARPIDGHRLSEFVYGTITGMVAISGLDPAHSSWSQAAEVIIVGAAAIWIAHAYSVLLGRRIASERRLTGKDLAHALRGSWPIVIAGVMLAVPTLLAAANISTLATALRISSLVGVVILALVGIVAGVVTHETWPRRLLLAVLTTGLGLVVLGFELAIHH
jgi:hypothetical protein